MADINFQYLPDESIKPGVVYSDARTIPMLYLGHGTLRNNMYINEIYRDQLAHPTPRYHYLDMNAELDTIASDCIDIDAFISRLVAMHHERPDLWPERILSVPEPWKFVREVGRPFDEDGRTLSNKVHRGTTCGTKRVGETLRHDFQFIPAK